MPPDEFDQSEKVFTLPCQTQTPAGTQLFETLTADTDSADYTEHVALLKEYCNLGKSMQQYEARAAFFKALVTHGVFDVLCNWLRRDGDKFKQDALEILHHYANHHMDMVRIQV